MISRERPVNPFETQLTSTNNVNDETNNNTQRSTLEFEQHHNRGPNGRIDLKRSSTVEATEQLHKRTRIEYSEDNAITMNGSSPCDAYRTSAVPSFIPNEDPFARFNPPPEHEQPHLFGARRSETPIDQLESQIFASIREYEQNLAAPSSTELDNIDMSFFDALDNELGLSPEMEAKDALLATPPLTMPKQEIVIRESPLRHFWKAAIPANGECFITSLYFLLTAESGEVNPEQRKAVLLDLVDRLSNEQKEVFAERFKIAFTQTLDENVVFSINEAFTNLFCQMLSVDTQRDLNWVRDAVAVCIDNAAAWWTTDAGDLLPVIFLPLTAQVTGKNVYIMQCLAQFDPETMSGSKEATSLLCYSKQGGEQLIDGTGLKVAIESIDQNDLVLERLNNRGCEHYDAHICAERYERKHVTQTPGIDALLDAAAYLALSEDDELEN